jgi:16S rRNA C1402 N4-methylase RsmH
VRDSTIEHVPVLANKLAELVSLPQDAVMVDSTIGHGGHSLLFGRFLGPEGVIVGLDCDIKAIQRAQSSLKDLSCKVILHNTNFINIGDVLRQDGIEQVDFILADLGISSSKALRREGKRKWLRKHPATRTFQALRIAVNDELENLRRLIAAVPGILKSRGIVAVISFHSLEDRIVKNDFRDKAKQGIYKLRTKKPVRPSEEETSFNRRARSAKLRIAEKI